MLLLGFRIVLDWCIRLGAYREIRSLADVVPPTYGSDLFSFFYLFQHFEDLLLAESTSFHLLLLFWAELHF